jgi:hypothetical protein
MLTWTRQGTKAAGLPHCLQYFFSGTTGVVAFDFMPPRLFLWQWEVTVLFESPRAWAIVAYP